MGAINIDLFRLLNNFGKDFPATDPISIFLAKWSWIILFLALIGFWFIGRKPGNRVMVISSIVAFVLAFILGRIGGAFYSHFQPFVTLPDVNKLIHKNPDNSFPSDHTFTFFAITMSFWFFRVRHRWIWLSLATLVAVSRVVVGVHYPVDVFFGAIFGIIGAYAAFRFIPQLPLIHKGLEFYTNIENKVLPPSKS